MSFQINHIYVKNFLSFSEAEINFDDLTVLVGPNASGKSNVIKIFRFLQAIASSNTNLPGLIRNEFSYDRHQHLFYNNNEPITLKVNFSYNKKKCIYEIIFNLNCRILQESLDGTNINSISVIKENETNYANTSEGRMGVDPYTSFWNYYGDSTAQKIKEKFSQIASYAFVPDRIRTIYPIQYNESLMHTGENLVQVLHTLLTNKRTQFTRIESLMRDIIPQIEQINTPPEHNTSNPKTRLTIKEKNLDKLIDYTNISDGTLRLLAFVTALNLESDIVTFEEPENFIHPQLFQTLIDLFKKSEKQIILTTHSQHLINQTKVCQMRLLSKKGTESSVENAKNLDEVTHLLSEGFFLGEIWYTGRLEGSEENEE